MKTTFLAMLFVLLTAAVALALDTSHSCSGCHPIAKDPVTGAFSMDMTKNSGVNNLCLNCHKPDTMRKSFTSSDLANPFGSTNLGTSVSVRKQTSHNWAAPANVPAAGAATALDSGIAAVSATKQGIISCASCHNNHDFSTFSGNNLLRLPIDNDQLCFDCHRSRKTTDVQKGTGIGCISSHLVVF